MTDIDPTTHQTPTAGTGFERLSFSSNARFA